ncbi:MAG: 2Fe-2S iron-sulfur cluster-binding protein, partial [bacterium]
MKVKICRQQSPDSMPYWETFDYDGPEDNSVAGLLDYLNYHDDIVNDREEKTDRIGWECSCLQAVCGA